MRKIIDMVGQRFGKLVVVEYIGQNVKGHSSEWKCVCDCGKQVVVLRANLVRGSTNSCGCYKKEKLKNIKRKNNIYELDGICGIGYTSKNQKFYFDLEDYEKIKAYCWYYNNYIYANNRENGSPITMHRLILNFPKMQIDHINRNTLDNRKNNLRICNNQQNSFNRNVNKTSSSKISGVTWDKDRYKWVARITFNSKGIFLGRFENLEDAIKARLIAEKSILVNFLHKTIYLKNKE